MAKAKKATKKRPAKKAAKKAPAKKRPAKKAAKKAPAHHLAVAHKAILRVLDTVTADDKEGIARLRRMVDHAHENASARRR